MRKMIGCGLFLMSASLGWGQNAKGNPENGKKVFERMICSSCHGHEGQGGAAGARIGVKPPALPAFIAYVRRPAGNMPPFSPKVISDAELTDIHAYLSSIKAPPPVKDIPLLNQ
jgi:ubiquinol-cytochrome c reductase cytochrome c subunit